MEKPIIGVTPLWDEKKNSVWMFPGYLECIKLSGGIPLIFPFTDNEEDIARLVNMCDGILFTGGHDVSPYLYKEKPLDNLISTYEPRDILEKNIFLEAIKLNKPILGICRGLQLINVMLGGTLYQDLPLQYPSDVNPHQTTPYDNLIHDIDIFRDSPLYNLLKVNKLGVNSFHHQAIKDLAPSLKAMAIAPDNIIESIYLPNYPFLWAVQWHPDFLYQTRKEDLEIVKAFVKACK